MMKKKHREQEESKEKDINKSTENKVNSHNPENNNNNNSDASYSADAEEDLSTPAGAEAGTTDKVVTEGKTVEEKLSEMQDKYIRLSAEFDNYRKRTLREKMELSKYASEDLLLKILPLMDDFDRAQSHIGSATDIVAVKDGINLIYNKLSEFLKQNGVREIESLSSNFDVDLHEAIAKIPVDEVEKKGKVMDVVQKGYYLQDKVLRFSKVVVGE